jgi:hypothetical protein
MLLLALMRSSHVLEALTTPKLSSLNVLHAKLAITVQILV